VIDLAEYLELNAALMTVMSLNMTFCANLHHCG